MISTLLTFWSALKSKAVIYGLAIATILLIIWRVSSSLITSGRQQERLKQYEDQIKEQKQNAQIKARNDSASTDDLRKRMQHDWSRTDK